jgi:hypothetical protein
MALCIIKHRLDLGRSRPYFELRGDNDKGKTLAVYCKLSRESLIINVTLKTAAA